MKNSYRGTCLLSFLLTLLSSGLALTQTSGDTVHIQPVQGNIYMLTGAGGNIAISIGNDGVLLVDSGLPQFSDKVLAEIGRLSNKPIRRIINTHFHTDHTGGNENIAQAGLRLERTIAQASAAPASKPGAVISAHLNVLNRMSGVDETDKPVPSGLWPENTWETPRKDFYINDEGLEVIYLPNAHTDGDSIVFFRRSDVVSTGDIFIKDLYPVIDLQHGGSINGIIAGLNRIIEITIPKERQEGGTLVIPGHGRLCDEDDVVNYRDMATIVRDRIQNMITKGMTLEQIKAARPTLDYDPLYGSTAGFWTTDMFVEAVHKSLMQHREKQ